jgi:SAM-dependent methyltransferase
MTTQEIPDDIRVHVRQHYGEIAERFQPGDNSSCGCGAASDSCCSNDGFVKLYEADDVGELPTDVTGLSLGCGDPITLAALQPGQTVLDLGSGGGIDCFLAARRVGPTGHVIGVDMTSSMLERARANQKKTGLENVEFRLGEIEHLPVADATVDVIISNCVINLSPDKPQVFREAFRALKPGGKLAVSDVVTQGTLPETLKSSLSAWAGCIAGALDINDYIAGIQAAGFEAVQITPVYLDRESVDEALAQLKDEIPASIARDESLYQAVFSAKITAYKPVP